MLSFWTDPEAEYLFVHERLPKTTPSDGVQPCYRVSTWETGFRAELRYHDDDLWLPAPLNLNLLGQRGQPLLRRPPGVAAEISNVSRFFAAIPERIRRFIGGHFSYRQHSLLQLATQPRGFELIESCPGLAWMAVDTAARRPSTLGESWFLLKRRTLLEAASVGRARQGDLRFVQKLSFEGAPKGSGELLTLRAHLGGLGAEFFKHERCVSFDDLSVVISWPELTRFPQSFRREVLERARLGGNIAGLRDVMRDTRRMELQLRRGDANHVEQCATIAQLHRLHDRWIDEWMAHVASTSARSFPSPPIAGTEHIVPLESEGALKEEARLMRHCIASFALDVRRGRLYCYRVLAPQRATLSLKRDGTKWTLDQLYGERNSPPDTATLALVMKWLGL